MWAPSSWNWPRPSIISARAHTWPTPIPVFKSYGIEVAKLAGLPADVVNRAREVLAEHESAERSAVKHLAHDETQETAPLQLTIFTPLSQKIVDRIKETDLNRISPMDALTLLHELKKQMD